MLILFRYSGSVRRDLHEDEAEDHSKWHEEVEHDEELEAEDAFELHCDC